MTNRHDQILLNRQRAIDELFPLQSSKIVESLPMLTIIFYKGMTQLDFLLGDPKQKNATVERDIALKKLQEDQDRKEAKQRTADEKQAQIEKMKEIEIKLQNDNDIRLGFINTLAFCFFAVMHVTLALTQYNV